MARGTTRAEQKVRLQVMERDGWLCQRCGAPATDAGHIVPRSHGGAYTLDNLQAECASCNRGDGHAIAASTAATPAGWSWLDPSVVTRVDNIGGRPVETVHPAGW